MNPGTINNNEGTGDRDLGFSELMRQPREIRAVDNDVHPRCKKCKHAIARFEAKRMPRPTEKWVLAHTEYNRIDANLLGVRAYFIREVTAPWISIQITDVTDEKLRPLGRFSRANFILWVEQLGAEHRCKEKP